MGSIGLLVLLLTPPQVNLDDLESTDPSVARTALEEVIRLGDESVLESVAKTSPRARLALAEVKAHKRFGHAYPMAMSLSYEAKDKPGKAVIDDLQVLLGMRIELGYGLSAELVKDREISLKFRSATLLEVMDSLASSLGAEGWIENGAVRLTSNSVPTLEPLFYWRHFRTSLHKIREADRTDAARGVQTGQAWLDFNILTDGRCRIAGHAGVREVEYVEDTGRSQIARLDLPQRLGALPRSTLFSMTAPIGAPSKTCAKFTRLRGTVCFLMPDNPVQKETPTPLKGETINVANLTIKIDESTDFSKIHVSVTSRDKSKVYVMPVPTDFQLKSRNGTLITASGNTVNSPGSASLTLRFECPREFEASHLVMRVFQSVSEHLVPFEFKEVRIR